jgi:hypothetical protein
MFVVPFGKKIILGDKQIQQDLGSCQGSYFQQC